MRNKNVDKPKKKHITNQRGGYSKWVKTRIKIGKGMNK